MKAINKVLDMLTDYQAGMTYAEIGSKHGVSRQRVHQLLAPHGVTRSDGGAHLRAQQKKSFHKSAASSRRATRIRTSYRCSVEEYDAIMHGRTYTPDSLADQYIRCRNNWERRGIEYTTTFPEWYRRKKDFR